MPNTEILGGLRNESGVDRQEQPSFSYLKVIVSNGVIEVYEMENTPYIPDRREKSESYNEFLDIRDFEYWDKSDKLKEAWTRHKNAEFHKEREKMRELTKCDRKEERRKQTLRDARNNLRRLALSNFDGKSSFITLTFAENVTDVPYADDEFKKFMKRLRHKFKHKDAKYIAVREFQRRGAVHFHMISDINLPDCKDEEEIKELERFIGGKVWKHGFVDIKKIDHVDNVGAYLTKYMDKDFDDGRLEGRKAYLSSKGLEQPREYKGEEAMKILEEYGIGQKIKKAFTNSYTSEYLGQIVYTEYNLKRPEGKQIKDK